MAASSPLLDTRILTVDLSKGAADYSSINEAIRAASDGDTIVLRAGSYEEKILLDKAVHITTDSEAEPGDIVVTSGCIATCNNNAGGGGLNGIAPCGSITNLIIQQLVDVRAGSVLIQRCEMTLGSDGVRVCAGASPTISKCRIHNCQNAGIYFQEESGGIVEECEISNIRGDGIHVKGPTVAPSSSSPNSTHNTMTSTAANNMSHVSASGSALFPSPPAEGSPSTPSQIVIRESIIHHCTNGIYFRKGGKAFVDRNAVHTVQQFGVYIQSLSDPIVTRNQIEGCGIHGIFISKEGAGQIRDNAVNGSVRVYKGCSPVLGTNTVTGTVEAEAIPPA